MKWVAWANATFAVAVVAATRDPSAKGELEMCLSILDEALEGRPFLLGEYTLVDTHLGSFIDWLHYLKVDVSSYARLDAWAKRCAARPAHARVAA